MKSLLYVSPLLSQAWNTSIKRWFLHRLSLAQGWCCWECPGQLSLGVLWSPGWLKYCRLSLWLLARGISWLFHCQHHSAFKVCFLRWQGWGSVHTWRLQSLKLHRPFQMGTNLSPPGPVLQLLIGNCEYKFLIELLDKGASWEPPNSPGYC